MGEGNQSPCSQAEQRVSTLMSILKYDLPRPMVWTELSCATSKAWARYHSPHEFSSR